MYKKNSGFTLIELMIVIAIIGILLAIIAPNITGYRNTAENIALENDFKAVYNAVVAYDNFEYIGSDKALQIMNESLNGTDSYNVPHSDLAPYLSDNIYIASGVGVANNNEWGCAYDHLQPNQACVHIIRPGGRYSAAGITGNEDKTSYVIEMVDYNGEKQRFVSH